jgi:glycosyltransferase involved in cell wall biosynthesis
VQPSWYEGFGFPILEAMEQNTPVLSSGKGSLKEVGGEHAHYFDPTDHAGFVAMLKDLLKNKSKREQYVSSAKVWAHSFTWERVIEGTHAVYEKVLG